MIIPQCHYCYQRARFIIKNTDGDRVYACKKHMMKYVSPLQTHLTERIYIIKEPLFHRTTF